ncbi:hypothetical protein [Corynebacterium halotolerans]|nr:hypothetical protein [Corynebacterium halotolerans]
MPETVSPTTPVDNQVVFRGVGKRLRAVVPSVPRLSQWASRAV